MSFEDLDDYDTFLTQAKQEASAWAKELLSNPTGFVILDTETTGLDYRAEVCQIAVLRGDGVVLMDTLVKPRSPIPAEATRIHHITNEMVAAAPGFELVLPDLDDILDRYERVIVYNAEYDARLLSQSLFAVKPPWRSFGPYGCAMLQYARWYGDWNDYHGSFRWQKLQGGDHSALGDCRATLQVLHKMAGVA